MAATISNGPAFSAHSKITQQARYGLAPQKNKGKKQVIRMPLSALGGRQLRVADKNETISVQTTINSWERPRASQAQTVQKVSSKRARWDISTKNQNEILQAMKSKRAQWDTSRESMEAVVDALSKLPVVKDSQQKPPVVKNSQQEPLYRGNRCFELRMKHLQKHYSR
ncbi:hypothetical protein [Endozoicomonas atrinae]|uniref:hypothetical protein n=1 Tax=Endozoicomonas atrinae TaxID=1333660 RepID=UPI003B004497